MTINTPSFGADTILGSNYSLAPTLVDLGGGKVMAVWYNDFGGGQNGVYAAVGTIAGGFGAPVLVRPGVCNHDSVVVLGNGDVAIASNIDYGAGGIRIVHPDAQNNTLSLGTNTFITATSTPSEISLVSDGNGGVLASYFTGKDNNAYIYVQQFSFDNSGQATAGTATNLTFGSSITNAGKSIATMTSGAVVTWVDNAGAIKAVTVGPTGATTGSELTLATTTIAEGSYASPSAIYLGNRLVLVTYFRAGAESFTDDLKYAVYNIDTGANLSGEQSIPNNSLWQREVDLSINPNGTVNLLFATRDSTTGDSFDFGIDGLVISINSNGTIADTSAEFRVNTVPFGGQSTPNALVMADGTVLTTWASGNEGIRIAPMTFATANSAPTGSPSATLTNGIEDVSFSVTEAQLLMGFSDADNDPLTATITSITNGTFENGASGGYTITPNANYNGPITITYTVSDGNGGEMTEQIRTLTLAAVNDAPTGEPTGTLDAGTEDVIYTGSKADLLAGFTDVDSATLTATVTAVSHGSFTDNGADGYTITPPANYNGVITVTYRVSDGNSLVSGKTRTVTFDAVDDAPIGSPENYLAETGIEDTPYTVSKAELLQNFSDPDGDTLTATITSVEHSTFHDNGDGTYTITPDANFNGLVKITFSVSDGTTTRTDQEIYQYLSAIGDAPTGSPSATLAAGTEDVSFSVTEAQLLMGFSDVDGDTLTATITEVTNGSFEDDGIGGYTITPDENYNGLVTITYDVTDGTTTLTNRTRTFTLAAVNDVPSGPSGNYLDPNGDEDTPYIVSQAALLAGFSDVDGDTLTATITSVYHGTAELNIDGSYTITPEADYAGTVNITFSVSDGTVTLENYNQNLYLNPVNDAPKGSPTGTLDAGTEDVVYTGSKADLLAGFTDVDSATLTATVTAVSHGSFIDNGADGYTITPPTNYNGAITVTYSVSDGTNTLTNEIQSLYLNAVDDAPTGDATTVLTGTEDTPFILTNADLLTGYSDVDGDTLSVSYVDADHGSIQSNGGGTYTYTPDANYNGIVTFTYDILAGEDSLTNQTQTLTLAAVNDAPTGAPTATLLDGREDTAYTVTKANLLVGFSDVDSVQLTATITGVDHGTFDDDGNGGYTITPEANYNNPVTITYSVSDGTTTLTNRTRSFNLEAMNDAPTGSPTVAFAAGDEDTLITLFRSSLLAGFTDVDGDTMTATITSVSNGTFEATSNGRYRILPAENFNGELIITYSVSDGNGGTLTGQTVSVTLNPVNDAPTGQATVNFSGLSEDNVWNLFNVDLLEGYTDAEGDTLTATVTGVTHGSFGPSVNGVTVITPDANYNGAVTVTYTVSDGKGGEATGQTLTVNFDAVNDAPSAITLTNPQSIAENNTGQITIGAVSGTDVDSAAPTISLVSGAGDNALFTITGGNLVFTGTADYETKTSYSVTLRATDAAGLTFDSVKTILVTDVNDTSAGTAGNDTLSALSGAATLVGLAGNDLYYIDGDDTVTEAANAGNDTISSSATTILAANVERLILTGTGNINGTGNALANVITGNAGNNILDGGTDSLVDTLIGGDGNDTYVLGSGNDSITDSAGTDTITSLVNRNLATYATIENLTLLGSTGLTGTGNALANVITGNAGNNILDGGDGNDTLVGGDGNDTYVLAAGNDSITDSAGTDTILSTISRNMTDYATVENLILQGTSNIDGTGNALANVITGNAGANILDGGAGNDTLIGGAGNDSYVLGSGDDSITDTAGIDTITSAINRSLISYAAIENLTLTGSLAIVGTGNTLGNILTGSSANNTLVGMAGNDTLDGGDGNDTLEGGTGNDVYILGSGDDSIIDVAGTDTVTSLVTRSLVGYASVENLTLAGAAAINGTGNSLANVITGNTGDNILDGGSDALVDMLIGGAGNDTYVLAASADKIIDSAGTDTITSTISRNLTAFGTIENLTLLGSANIDGTGNALANMITGNSGANILSGGGGDDTLAGGAGNDIYDVTQAVTIIEGASAGTDLVRALISYTLGDNLENLTLTGTAALSGTGNSGDNYITGNLGDNTLDGGAGNDTLSGGAGNDTYIVGEGDFVTERFGTGTDTVRASITFSIDISGQRVFGEIENLILTGESNINGTGNALANVITGNSGANQLFGGAGNDTLDGGAGNDTLTGGDGNDTYVLGDGNDVVAETGTGSADLVTSTITRSLANLATIENLTLLGSDSIGGTGNALNNVITGNAAANILDGGDGNDTLIGGEGGDTYILGAGNDVVKETGTSGVDTVTSTITRSLAKLTTIENLTLLGTDTINGTGNTGANLITGNTGANLLDGGAGHDTLLGDAGNDTLTGGAGNDTLDGGEGNDALSGGDGNDTYVLGAGNDVVSDSAGVDLITSTITRSLANRTTIENLTLLGTDAINGTGNTGANLITGNTGANLLDGGLGNDTLLGDAGNDTLTGGAGNDTLDGGDGDDTLTGGDGNDNYVLGAGNDVVTDSAGVDLATSTITRSLANLATIENLTLLGTGNIDGTGNSGSNVITGNSGNNRLDGGLGTDTLAGGLGDDSYVVNQSTGLTITELAGGGTDTVISTVTYALGTHLENLTLDGSVVINGTGNSTANRIIGNSAANTLTGLGGNDTLTGNGGADTFVFATGFGKDTITDFVIGTGHDVLKLSLGKSYDSFAEVYAKAADVGGNTVITFDANTSITLTGIDKAELTADHFLF